MLLSDCSGSQTAVDRTFSRALRSVIIVRESSDALMRKLIVFNNITLDGYFTDRNGDMSWAHQHDPEWIEFVQSNASGGGELLFGRKTYDLMASYWPTPDGQQE